MSRKHWKCTESVIRVEMKNISERLRLGENNDTGTNANQACMAFNILHIICVFATPIFSCLHLVMRFFFPSPAPFRFSGSHWSATNGASKMSVTQPHGNLSTNKHISLLLSIEFSDDRRDWGSRRQENFSRSHKVFLKVKNTDKREMENIHRVCGDRRDLRVSQQI